MTVMIRSNENDVNYDNESGPAVKPSELLLHPVRLRVAQSLLGHRSLTTTELRHELPDVAPATLYRQVATLVEGRVLEVVDERRVRGTFERTYRLRGDGASIDAAQAAAMTPEEHRQGFLAFVAALLADYDRYLDTGDVDLGRDLVGYRQAALNLSDAELVDLLSDLRVGPGSPTRPAACPGAASTGVVHDSHAGRATAHPQRGAPRMRALTFDPRGEQWRLRSLPVPTFGGHDVLVRVEACGLNPVDAKIAMWKSAVEEMNENWVAGLDVAGEIAAVGESVTGWQVGDRVLTHGNMFRPHGGLAQFTVQDARTLVPHPVGIGAAAAAATPCAGWTAWRALHDRLRVTAADTLLVAGGSGGVGGFALQIAKDAGLRSVIATTSARNVEYAVSLGASDVIDYAGEDVVSRVHEITGGVGVGRGLDTVGGDNARLVADCLGFEGRWSSSSMSSTPSRSPTPSTWDWASISSASGRDNRNGEVGRQTLTRTGLAFNRALETGRVSVPRLEVVGLEGASDALTSMLDQRNGGQDRRADG